MKVREDQPQNGELKAKEKKRRKAQIGELLKAMKRGKKTAEAQARGEEAVWWGFWGGFLNPRRW